MNFSFSEYPFLRIVIPFVSGIILSETGISNSFPLIIALFAIAALIILKSIHQSSIRYQASQLYPIAFFCIYLSIGWLCMELHKPKTLDNSDLNKETFFVADIKSVRHRNITTEMKTICRLDNKHIPLIVTLQGNDYNIKTGDRIACYSSINEFHSSNVPESFDYKRFMENNGFKYQTYVKKSFYSIIGHNDDIHSKSTELKTSLISKIRQTGLNHSSANFIIALLTGDDDYISPTDRESFSKSGLAHILAVSGLHIGIIGLIIAFLFKPLDFIGLKKLRLGISILLIWSFAYFTGLPSSACRAAIMATFLIIAIILHKKHSIVNALSASAIFILLFDPSELYGIGFQLSYLSVIGILTFANNLTFGNRYSFPRKVTSLIAVSIAAQLGTAIIAIYYFNMFPLTFLISNAIVVPLLPLFIFLALIAIVLSATGLKFNILNDVIDLLYNCISNISNFANSTPEANSLWIDGATAICISIAILTIGLWINQRKQKHATPLLYSSVFALSVGIVVFIHSNNNIQKEGLFITDGYSSTNIIYYRNNLMYILNSQNDTSEISNFIRNNDRFRIRQGIDSIINLGNGYVDKFIYANYPYVSIRGINMGYATGNIKKRQAASFKINIDYLIITNNYYNKISDLPDYYNYYRMVIPNEIYSDDKKIILNELNKYGIKYIDLFDKTDFIDIRF